MNPIQKAWLKVLSPVVTLVNDKLAKRSGMVGKMARFFAFGPRQFGFHPINKIISLANKSTMTAIAQAMHVYPFFRHLNLNGYITARPYAFLSILGKWTILGLFFLTLMPTEMMNEQGTTLEMFTNKNIPVPYNALNDRVSAHYTEINSLYSHMMTVNAAKKAEQIKDKWDRTNDKTRKMRFARPGYQYIEPHSKAE